MSPATSLLMSCPSCDADTVTLVVVSGFLYFYSAERNPHEKSAAQTSKSDRMLDIVFFRKGSRYSLHEFNKTFALSGLTLLSIGLALQSVVSIVHKRTDHVLLDAQFLDRIVWGGATLARLHAGYSVVEYYKRLAPSSLWFHAMWKGLLAVSVLNLIAPYGFLEDPNWTPECVMNVMKWGRENYESSALILLAAAVAHFVSMDTTVDRRRSDSSEENGKERTKMGGERDFEMNLRPFGYVALAASCIGACLIALKGLF